MKLIITTMLIFLVNLSFSDYSDDEVFYTNFKNTSKLNKLLLSDSKINKHNTNGLLINNNSIKMKIPSKNNDISVYLVFNNEDKNRKKVNPIGQINKDQTSIKLGLNNFFLEISNTNFIVFFWDNKTKDKQIILNKSLDQEKFYGIHELGIEQLGNYLKFIIDGEIFFNINYRNKIKRNISFGTFNGEILFTELRITRSVKAHLIEYNSILARAIYNPKQFNNSNGLKNHHLIVDNQGRARKHALFNTIAPDSCIHDELINLGFTAGNNLTKESWTEIKKKNSKESNKLAMGDEIIISVKYKNKEYPISDIITDINGKKLEFKFSGNRKLIPIWHSGCVVCLQSCPGGKMGHSAYSMRDLQLKKSKYKLNKQFKAIPKGSNVYIRFSKK